MIAGLPKTLAGEAAVQVNDTIPVSTFGSSVEIVVTPSPCRRYKS